jgi:hypothetical protein
VILHADLDAATVTLREPADFFGFHVAVAGGPVDDERLPGVLAPHGRIDGEHAWIDRDAVVALAGDEADDAWHAGFDAMVEYARSKGFLSEDSTSIRAHLDAS